MLTYSELEALCMDLENARVEKTVSKRDFDKFAEAICAFSNDLPNTDLPGYLLIGINDDGTRAGLTIEEKLLQSLLDFRSDGRIIPAPVLIVERFVFPDGEVAVVEVTPSNLPPVRYKGRVWIRAGARKGIANEQEERILSEKRSFNVSTYDAQPCIGSTIDDLKLGYFTEEYLPQAISKEILEANHRDKVLQLASLKFFDLENNCPTILGILAFGKNPMYWIPGAYIQFVKFEGEDVVSNFTHEQRFTGNLVQFLPQLPDFIRTKVIRTYLPELGGERYDNYPVAAILELLYNAIMHRDYHSNAPIKFYQFSDHIEIANNGGLYGSARPENFPNVSAYRNPGIAEVLRTLEYVNRFNVGIDRVKAALEKNGNPEPVFTYHDPHYFKAEIYVKPDPMGYSD